MTSRTLLSALLCAAACAPDDASDTLEPGVCGDGVLNLDEACDVPGDPGCDAACHLTDEIVWTVTRGEPGVFLTYPQDVAVGADGRIYVLGFRWGGGDLPDDGEGWLLALEPDGGVRWEIDVQTPGGGEGVRSSRVAVDADGSVYHQGLDVFSYTADGALRWKFAETTDLLPEPGASLRAATGLAVADDAVFTASYGYRDLVADVPPTVDASVRRHDPATGALVWETVLRGVTDVAWADALTVSGDTVVAAGPSDPEGYGTSAFACAVVGSGYLVPCAPTIDAFVSRMIALTDGDLVLVGADDEGGFVRRMDLVGAIAWEIPSNEQFGVTGVAGGPDGTIALAGNVGEFETVSAAVRILDGDGATSWTLTIDPQGDEELVSAAAVVHGPGFLVVTGSADRFGAVTTPWVRRIGPAT